MNFHGVLSPQRISRHTSLRGSVQIVFGDAKLLSLPGGRIELPRGFKSPTDFKSVASADSAIRAGKALRIYFAKQTIPADKSVASADSLPAAGRRHPGTIKKCSIYPITTNQARGGIEPPYIGFADRCITTLLPRRQKKRNQKSATRIQKN